LTTLTAIIDNLQQFTTIIDNLRLSFYELSLIIDSYRYLTKLSTIIDK
jgi:hypothetical protein